MHFGYPSTEIVGRNCAKKPFRVGILCPSANAVSWNNEHVYSPTRQRDRQRQIIYSWLKYTVNSSYTVT